MDQLSRWFYLGVAAVLISGFMIWRSRNNNKSKLMENGYFLLVLGAIGIVSEFTNFANILLLFVVISGVILLLDKLFWSKKRESSAVKPHYVYYAREFFPIVLVVWILRAFLFEAYQIPSSSMRPGLTVGDFILVNKFSYGVKLPITNQLIIPVNHVARGDVVVFADPNVRNRDLIKRVIGLPGDKISYKDKRLTINDQELNYVADGSYAYAEQEQNGEKITINTASYIEDLLGLKYKVINWDRMPSVVVEMVQDFAGRDNCQYDEAGFVCQVPQGKYFVMGDNRDNSADSRYWGFVDENTILGKAIYVWLNFGDFSRIGTKI